MSKNVAGYSKIRSDLNARKNASDELEAQSHGSPVESKNASKNPRMGRPKGGPMIARSIRIKPDIYDRLVDKHEETRIPFNDLMNMALDEYLK